MLRRRALASFDRKGHRPYFAKTSVTAGVLLASFALVAIAGGGASGGSVRTGQNLPTPREILDNYIKALGGADAITRHKSRTRKGAYKDDAGNSGSVVEYFEVNKMLIKYMTAKGDYIRSGDANFAWTSNPKSGPRLVQHFIPEFWKREADLQYPLHITEYFRSYEVVGSENFEGLDCFHIKGVTNWGDQNEQFYDKRTGLLAGYRFPNGPSKDAPLAIEGFQDYKQFDGLLVPTKEISRDPDGGSTTTYTSVTFDDVNDTVFEVPPAVKQQIKDSKSK